MTFQRRQILGMAAVGLASFGAMQGFAQAWPTRTLRLLSPYGAGGASDILTRILGEYLAHKLQQSVVVENKPGAGTRIANEFITHAAPDGYTILHAAAPIAIGEALYAHLPYDVQKDFTPIVSTAIAPLFLVVNAEAPYKTLAEFIQYGKDNPKGITFGTPGVGSAPHLTAELFLRAAGVQGVSVHFRGDAPAYNELLGARIDATLTAVSTAVPHIQAGKLRVLAVSTEERTSVYQDAPTFSELGFPKIVGYGWYGLMGPAGLSHAIVERLNAETNAAIADPEIRKKAEAVGLQLRGGTPAAFAGFIRSETRKWEQVVKGAGITVE